MAKKLTPHKKIKAHFKKVDPKIYEVMKDMDFADWMNPIDTKDYFSRLARSIISQQLSVKAAGTIITRVLELFPKKKLTAEKLLKIPDEKLREAGMSWAKAKYVKDLAQKTVDKQINYSKLKSMTDEQVIEELTQVKGIGLWTSEMFLIFALGHEDVFSHADAGLRRGMKKVYNLKSNPDLKKAEKITKKWSPYRSYGSMALWQSLE